MRRLRSFILQNFAPVWRLIEKSEFLSRKANGLIINQAVKTSRTRPHPFSTISDYTSWDSLTDKNYFARHVRASDFKPPADLDAVLGLFGRNPAEGRECSKSTMLFPVFAQYLTDGFLRTVMDDRARTTSNHEIDLSSLYGRTSAQANILRLGSDRPGEKGRLKSQMLDGEEYPLDLFLADGNIDPQFLDDDGKPLLDMPLGLKPDPKKPGEIFTRRIFAVGGDRANATTLVSMFNCLMLREHNRLAGELERRNEGWDDERVFQTARNILIALYIKLVIEDYINHISSTCFNLRADPAVCWDKKWNRPNWMTTEFTLLYRWHSLIPNHIEWNGKRRDASAMVLDNAPLIEAGLAKGFLSVAGQNATKIDLHNTADFLTPVEQRSLQQARDANLASYNEYRNAMRFPTIEGFDQMTADPERQAELQQVFGSVGGVEFFPALFAEDSGTNTPMPPLLGAMVALDAFSQALTNPLLSEHVFNEETFTPWGMEQIKSTGSVADLVLRNAPPDSVAGIAPEQIRMTRADWKRRWQPF